MSEARLLIGDVFERMAEIPDGSIDLVVTSPPFLALRSYLPADHPDKDKEIGSEATPADFLDTLLELTDEFGRVLAPHGSICIELGDTFSGSGGAGGDYNAGGMRDGQGRFQGSASKGRLASYSDDRGNPDGMRDTTFQGGNTRTDGSHGWPMAKSLTGIPTLYAWSLAYGRNLLGDRTIDPWRIRNVIVWARPNPPVGALGDKFRPATSYITVATKAQRRWFDLDAVRGAQVEPVVVKVGAAAASRGISGGDSGNPDKERMSANPAGAPPLDWHTDDHPEDGDWLWKLSTQPFSGAHYATYPQALPERLIKAMCPPKVCNVCGHAPERITETTHIANRNTNGPQSIERKHISSPGYPVRADTVRQHQGWTDCGHDDYRRGIVLDPFAGSGTTLAVASGLGRDSIGIDLDERNADLAVERCGMFLTVEHQ